MNILYRILQVMLVLCVIGALGNVAVMVANGGMTVLVKQEHQAEVLKILAMPHNRSYIVMSDKTRLDWLGDRFYLISEEEGKRRIRIASIGDFAMIGSMIVVLALTPLALFVALRSYLARKKAKPAS